MNKIKKAIFSTVIGLCALFNNHNLKSEDIIDPFDSTKVIKIENKVSYSDFCNGKETLIKKGVSKSLVDNIPKDYILEFLKIAKKENKETVEKVIHVHEIFGDDFKPFYIESCIYQIKECDNDFIKSLYKLKKINSSRLNFNLFEEHKKILSQGIPLEVLADINEDEIITWNKVSRCVVDKRLLEFYSENPMDELVKITKKINLNNLSSNVIKEDLFKRFSKRLHINSKFVPWSEDYHQLNNVNDVVLLSIIKSYDDFISDPSNFNEIKKLFSMTKDNKKIERLAMVSNNQNKIKLYHVFMDHLSSESNPVVSSRYCYVPPFFPYLTKFGLIHSHILEKGAKVQIYPTPSLSDFKALSHQQRKNSYEVDCVVSELSNNSFDADLFFREVYIENSKPQNKSEFIVIDLGVFNGKM